jgi:hypothetical protein
VRVLLEEGRQSILVSTRRTEFCKVPQGCSTDLTGPRPLVEVAGVEAVIVVEAAGIEEDEADANLI